MNEYRGNFGRGTIQMGSELLDYLAELGGKPGLRLPSIQELSVQLGISSGKLREQLEVARELGLVEVRPKTGIRTLPFTFFPAVRAALRYAVTTDPGRFRQYGLLRNHIEASFWREAVELLEPEDHRRLQELMQAAWEKLQGNPIQIPHNEHRDLHLAIYAKLENPFVLGLLEAYWDAYEAVGLNLYSDYSQLQEIWNYHQKMVDSIVAGDFEVGYQALVEHTGLLHDRPEFARTSKGEGNLNVPARVPETHGS